MKIKVSIKDYLWYYLYHAPRLRIDRRYREKGEALEALLRKAYRLYQDDLTK